MTKDEAKQLGGIRVKQFANGEIEATFTTVRACADFRHELTKREIEFKDRFAMGGKALTFRWRSQ